MEFLRAQIPPSKIFWGFQGGWGAGRAHHEAAGRELLARFARSPSGRREARPYGIRRAGTKPLVPPGNSTSGIGSPIRSSGASRLADAPSKTGGLSGPLPANALGTKAASRFGRGRAKNLPRKFSRAPQLAAKAERTAVCVRPAFRLPLKQTADNARARPPRGPNRPAQNQCTAGTPKVQNRRF